MGPLADKLKNRFPVKTRGKGASIEGRVLSHTTGEPPWSAVVLGSNESPYFVEIDPDDVEGGHCTCPAFEGHGPCKHMWATILTLDRAIEAALATGAEGATEAEWGTVTTRFSNGRRRQKSNRIDPVTHRLHTLRKLTDGPAPMRNLFDHVSQVHYGMPAQSQLDGSCRLGMGLRFRKGNGSFGSWQRIADYEMSLRDSGIAAADRELIARLRAENLDPYPGEDLRRNVTVLPAESVDALLRELAATERLRWIPTKDAAGAELPEQPITWDGDEPVRVRLTLDSTAKTSTLRAELWRDDAQLDLADVHACVGHHTLLVRGVLHRFVTASPLPIVRSVLVEGPIQVPVDRRAELEALLHGSSPRRVPPESCHFQLHNDLMESVHGRLARGVLEFKYGEELVDATEPYPLLMDPSRRRDEEAEGAWIRRFEDAGGILHWELQRPTASLPAKNLTATVEALLQAGFVVWAAMRRVQRVGSPRVSIASGVDWFTATIERDGDVEVDLPDLLACLKDQKSGLVRLGNGSYGLLDPQEQSLLADLIWLGEADGDAIRIPRARGLLLDALLAERADEAVQRDAQLEALRKQANTTVKPQAEPKGFGATLRAYQREGLGWFRFLARLGVGGCLADDMGLGKTVQVLALLEQQRRRRPHPGPSLVVAPRSLVLHWMREAERFAPKLRTLAFVGTNRAQIFDADIASGFERTDLVLTTYGSLRNDVETFADIEWHYLILDEAQAIKNENSQVSKAARLCKARHRLALSGTPIENHLGELWSLMEFLNPGMLGTSRTFKGLLRSAPAQIVASEDRGTESGGFHQTLRTAVRPFLLRRTKQEVLTELPAKSEQTLYCELPARQRKSYDELARHYQKALLGELDEQKLDNKMRFQVLEALLRLRQTACHPGLIDPARVDEACGKFEVLLPMLEEVRAEGNKALVFSQFPSLLRLLRDRLTGNGFEFAYLDGQTRKRQVQIDRFQNDPDCSLFLISLKAGGTGLNLTAASYVFLLDPWWNPAVEAQAIDRAHRIGQTRNVHAYRLICQDTVEEKVAALQESKVALADAVLGDDKSVLQGLTGADVARLLQS